MLENFLTSDTFLYPLYLAIKAAYLPTIWLGGGHLLAERIAVIAFCVFIALLNGAAIKWWLKLPLIAAGWALVSYPYMEFALLSLPVWPFLFWRRRYWGPLLALVGLALGCLIGFGASQFGGPDKSTEMFYYLGFIAFVIMRVRLPMPQRFRRVALSLLFAFLALYSAPKIYENHGERLFAKLYSVQPKLIWLKDPQKGETLDTSITFSTELLGKKYDSIAIVYDYVEVQSHYKDGEVITNLDKIYAYTPLRLRAKNKVYYFREIIKNDFHYQNFKNYMLYSEITANYDEIDRQIKLKEKK